MTLEVGTARLPRRMVHRPGCEKPDVVTHCACGENVSCKTCRWGSTTLPCTCMRERMAARGD